MLREDPSGHIVYRVALTPHPETREDPLVPAIQERVVQRLAHQHRVRAGGGRRLDIGARPHAARRDPRDPEPAGGPEPES